MKQYDLDSPTSCSLLCPPWSRVCWGQHLCVLCFLHVWCVVSTPSRNWIHLHRGQFVQNRCLRGAATQSKPSLMYPACLSFRQHRLGSIEMESEEWEALVSGCMLSPPWRFSCDSPSSWNGCWCRWQTRSSQPCGNILSQEQRGFHPLSWLKDPQIILICPQKETYVWLPWHKSCKDSPSSKVSLRCSSVGKTNLPSLTRRGGNFPIMSSKSNWHWPFGNKDVSNSNLQNTITFYPSFQRKDDRTIQDVHVFQTGLQQRPLGECEYKKDLTRIQQNPAHLGITDWHISW